MEKLNENKIKVGKTSEKFLKGETALIIGGCEINPV
jgi:hypothetical protein